MDLYEDEAVFAESDAIVRGTSDIRAAHQKFINASLSLTLNDSVVLETDSIALVHWSWTVTREDGTTFDGVSAEVMRRQSDGAWKFLIDNSDGSALVARL